MAESAAKFNRRQRERKSRAAKKDEEKAAPSKQLSAERSERRTEREGHTARRLERSETRELRNERSRKRQQVIRPIQKAAGAVSPKSGTSSSTALGLGVAGVAALLMTAGILHKKLGEVLENPGEEKKRKEEESAKEITPATEATQAPPTGTTKQFEEQPRSLPPNPLTGFPSRTQLERKHKTLEEELLPAVKYLEGLLIDEKALKISNKQRSVLFYNRYPQYHRWTVELNELVDEMEKIGMIKKGTFKA